MTSSGIGVLLASRVVEGIGTSFMAVLAPARTPQPIVERVSREILEDILEDTAYKFTAGGQQGRQVSRSIAVCSRPSDRESRPRPSGSS